MSCYDPNAARRQRLFDRDVVYPTPDFHFDALTAERTKGYRGYLQTVPVRLVNFYNPFDWGLVTGTTFLFNTNWETNQVSYKPDGQALDIPHAPTWSYQYDPSYPLRNRGWVLSAASRNVNSSFEMKAFIARSRTQAVGALADLSGRFDVNINLHDTFGFGDTRPDHSGQFTRNIQVTRVLYEILREQIEH